MSSLFCMRNRYSGLALALGLLAAPAWAQMAAPRAVTESPKPAAAPAETRSLTFTWTYDGVGHEGFYLQNRCEQETVFSDITPPAGKDARTYDFLMPLNLVCDFQLIAYNAKERSHPSTPPVRVSTWVKPDPPTGVSVAFVPQLLPSLGWRVLSADSADATTPAANAIDGKPGTIWRTPWTGARYPHELSLDLGAPYTLSGLRYLPRQDGGLGGMIKEYEVYLSADGLSWGAAAAKGAWAKDKTEKSADFPPTQARYVRLRALSEVEGKPIASAAEIGLIGY